MKKLLFLCLILGSCLFGCGSGSGADGGGVLYFKSGFFSRTVTPAEGYTTSTIKDSNNTDDTYTVTLNAKVDYYPTTIAQIPFSMNNLVFKYTKTTDRLFVITDYGSPNSSLPNLFPYTIARAGIKDQIYAKGFTAGDEFYVTAHYTISEGNETKSGDVYLAKVRFN